MFYLLCKLAFDPDVPVTEKAKLAAAIAYFVSPLDLIPEALVGPIGYIDDIAIAVLVLNSILNNTSKEVVMRNWVGDRDIVQLIQEIIKVADEMVGSGLWKKIKESFGKP